MKIYEGDIPFEANGSVPHSVWHNDKYVWQPNVEFFARIKILDYTHEVRSTYFTVQNLETGATYTMFPKDFIDLMHRHSIMRGETNSLPWVFCKKGTKYGVRLVIK